MPPGVAKKLRLKIEKAGKNQSPIRDLGVFPAFSD